MSHSASNTHHSILTSLKNENNNPSNPNMAPSTELNKKNWDTVDSLMRQKILGERKRSMMVKARESFMNGKDHE